MTRCDDIRAGLDDWLDGLLEERVYREVESHLTECEACAAYFQQQREMAAGLLALGDVANHIAAEGPTAKRSLARVHAARWPAIGVAAAILLIVGIGLYSSSQHRSTPAPSGGLAEAPQGGGAMETTKKIPFDLTIPEHCLARRVESENPRVHIVWLVQETLLPEPTSDDGNRENPAPSTQSI